MKIALLSGAVKNAGDYLITDRCSQALQAVYPDAEIRRYIRNHPLPPEQLEEVNDADCVIIGGGPYYKRNLYVFHRGTKADQYTGQKKAAAAEELSVRLRDEGFTVHDIAYGSAGFSLYDGCDLHVGPRVHAHIYNLSQRKRSILIEEDSRGAGVNEPLGLWSIKAYHRKKTGVSPLLVKAYSKVFGYPLPNPYVVDDLQAYLNCLENTDFRLMNQAFSQMEAYYENMLAYTLNI